MKVHDLFSHLELGGYGGLRLCWNVGAGGTFTNTERVFVVGN